MTRREKSTWEFAARTALLLGARNAAGVANAASVAQSTHGGSRRDDLRGQLHAASDAGGANDVRLLPIATGM
jgi:hypothetical protein